MAPNAEQIDILILAINKASAEIQAVQKDLVGLGATTKKANSEMSNFNKKLKKTSTELRGIGIAMTAAITLPLLALAKSAFAVSTEFEQSITNAFSVMQGASESARVELTAFARQLGRDTAFSATEAADAIYNLASAGLEVGEITGALPGILDAASATQSNLAAVTEVTAVAMKQFNITAEDSNRITDSMIAGITNSFLTFERFTESMKFAGSVMAATGHSIEEATAALAVFAEVGVFGEKAGTTLRQAIVLLLDPTSEMIEVLNRLGLSMSDVNPETKKLSEIMQTLQDAGAGVNDIAQLFGARAGPGMVAVLQKANNEGIKVSDTFADFESKMGATGIAAEVAAQQLDTVAGQLKILKSSIDEVFIAFKEDVFGDSIKEFITDVKDFVDGLGEIDAGTKKTIVAIGALLAAIGPLALIAAAATAAYAALATTVGSVILVIAGLVAGFIIFRDVLEPIFTQILIPLKDVFVALLPFFTGLITVLALMNPIIAVTVGALYLLSQAFLDGLTAVSRYYDAIQQGIELDIAQAESHAAAARVMSGVDKERFELKAKLSEASAKRTSALLALAEVENIGYLKRASLALNEAAKEKHDLEVARLKFAKETADAEFDDVLKSIKEKKVAWGDEAQFIKATSDEITQAITENSEEEVRNRIKLLKEAGVTDQKIQLAVLKFRGQVNQATVNSAIQAFNAEGAAAAEFRTKLGILFSKPIFQQIKVTLDAAGFDIQAALFQKLVQQKITNNITEIGSELQDIEEIGEDSFGGLGGGAGGAAKEVDTLAESIEDLTKRQLDFLDDALDVATTLETAFGGGAEEAETLIETYDDVENALKDIASEVDNLIKEHQKFVDSAQKGLDETLEVMQKINAEFATMNQEAVEATATGLSEDFADSLKEEEKLLKDLTKAEEELKEVRSDRDADADAKLAAQENVEAIEEAISKQRDLQNEFKKLTEDGADFTETLAASITVLEELRVKEKELADAGKDTASVKKDILNEEQNRLTLLGKQAIITDGINALADQEALNKAERELSELDFESYLLGIKLDNLAKEQAAAIKNELDLQKVRTAIVEGKVTELDLVALSGEGGLSLEALKLLEEAQAAEKLFADGLVAQFETLEKLKEDEIDIAEDTTELLIANQEVLETSLTASYDRLILKLKEVERAALAALAAKQAVGGNFDGGFLPEAFVGGQFAGGGYTGGGNIRSVAGVVHKGEWVAPNWMVKAFRPMFSQLENMRRNKIRGFADGGEVGGGSITNVPVTMNNTITSELDFNAAMRNMRWIFQTS